MHQRFARVVVFVVALAVGSGAVTAAGAAPLPHPTRGDVLVLRLTTVAPPGEWGGPTVVVWGDGHAVVQPKLGGPGHVSPEPLVFRINEAGLQRVVRGAASAGLLRHTDYGAPAVTDHRVTVVMIDVGAGRRVVQVEGLADRAADAGLTARQRSARAALRAFAGRVANPSFFDGTRVTD